MDDDESGVSRDGEIGVVSIGAIAPGTEVLFSYGQLSNHELLCRYGNFIQTTVPWSVISRLVPVIMSIIGPRETHDYREFNQVFKKNMKRVSRRAQMTRGPPSA